jgi:antitoxin PrlF
VTEILHSTLRERGQLTLPAAVRDALDVQVGDEIVFAVLDGAVMLSAGRLVPKSQAWFWSPEWQAGERAASADIAAGRTQVSTTVEDFVAELDS